VTATLNVNTVIGETAPSNLASEGYANGDGTSFAGVNTLYQVTTSTYGTAGNIQPQFSAIGYNQLNGWFGIGDNNTITATLNQNDLYSPGLLIKKNGNLYQPFTLSASFGDGYTIFELGTSSSVSTVKTEIGFLAALYVDGYWLVGNSSNNSLGLLDETGTLNESSLVIPDVDSSGVVGQISIGGITYFTIQGPSAENSSGNTFSPVYLVQYNSGALSLIATYTQFSSISAGLFNYMGAPFFLGTDANTYEQYSVTPSGAEYFSGSVGGTYVQSIDGSSGDALIGSYYSATSGTDALCGITNLNSEIIKQKSPMTSLYPPFSFVLPNGWMGFGVNSDNTLYPVTIDFTISVPVNEIQLTRNYCHNYSRGVPINYGGNLILPSTYNARLKP